MKYLAPASLQKPSEWTGAKIQQIPTSPKTQIKPGPLPPLSSGSSNYPLLSSPPSKRKKETEGEGTLVCMQILQLHRICLFHSTGTPPPPVWRLRGTTLAPQGVAGLQQARMASAVMAANTKLVVTLVLHHPEERLISATTPYFQKLQSNPRGTKPQTNPPGGHHQVAELPVEDLNMVPHKKGYMWRYT